MLFGGNTFVWPHALKRGSRMKRLSVLLAALLSSAALWASGGTPLPEGYADWVCTSPQVLTAPVSLGYCSTVYLYPTDLAWDGEAYGVVYTPGTYIYFARVAADGTVLAGPSVVDSSSATSQAPSIVWTGTEYGMAWMDFRDGNFEIYFARINADGVKQGNDVRITNDGASAFTSYYPSLAWSGTEYGVAWMDYRDGASEIYFARISAAGVKQGTDVRITNDGALGYVSELPSLAWSGSEYGVAWNDARDGNNEIYFARISAAGVKQGSDIRITNDGASMYISMYASLAWAGTEYGVAWSDFRDGNAETYFARIAPSGAKIGSEVRVSNDTNASLYPFISWTGAEYGLAWTDNRDGAYALYFTRMGATGSKLTGDLRLTGTNFSARPALAFGTLGYGFATPWINFAGFVGLGCHNDTTAPSCPSSLTTSYTGAGLTLSWQKGVDRETEVAYHRIYRDNAPIGITTAATYTDTPTPPGSPVYEVRAVNANGWESLGCPVVTAAPLTGDCGLPLSGEHLLSQSPASGGVPAVAWTGREYGVVWDDTRGGNTEIYFARMAADGTKLGGDVRITSGGTSGYWSVATSLVWTGSEYGVAWMDSRDGNYEIYFARISAAGVKQGNDVRITNDGASAYDSNNPSLAWSGTEYGVAWRDSRDGNPEIYFTRISSVGVKQGGDVRITNDGASVFISEMPSLTWTGAEYGVAWDDSRDGNYEIYFARVSAAGVKQGSDVRITNDGNFSFAPSLTWNGTEYGVAWHDSRDGNYEIYFARINAVGTKQGNDIRVTNASGSSQASSLAWAGTEYGVAWNDNRGGNYEIFYSPLAADGAPLAERLLTTAPASDYYPALAASTHGAGVVYERNLAQDQMLFQSLGCGAADTTPPTCPGALAETARTSASVTLGWTPSQEPDSDLGAYTIYKDGSAVGATTSTTYTDTAFDPVVGPVYSVVATNAAGLTSAGCTYLDTADPVPPTCPENLLASGVTQTSATLNWLPAQDTKSGLKQYKVYRNDLFLANVAAGTTTYTDSTLLSNTPYNFAVRAEDWAGNYSATCTTASVYVSTAAIVLFVTKNADRTNADLDWNHVNLNEYVVYRSASPQTASELKRVPVDQTQDPVLKDGVTLWYYYIQQRE